MVEVSRQSWQVDPVSDDEFRKLLVASAGIRLNFALMQRSCCEPSPQVVAVIDRAYRFIRRAVLAALEAVKEK